MENKTTPFWNNSHCARLTANFLTWKRSFVALLENSASRSAESKNYSQMELISPRVTRAHGLKIT